MFRPILMVATLLAFALLLPAASASPPPKVCTGIFPDSVFCFAGLDHEWDTLKTCLRGGACPVPDPLGRCPPDSWCPPDDS